MAKPPLPTQQEMRDYCRVTSGPLSNLSREWLKQRTTPSERVATYGYATINRDMAEVWEGEYLALTPAQQDPFLDWYINWYLTDRKRYDGTLLGDPDHEDPRYALGGYVVNRWRDPTVCECMFHVIGDTPGAVPTTWMRTHKTCSAHSGVGQSLRDTVYSESSRKSGALAIVEGLIDLETKDDLTTWAFSDDRIPGTDERVLELTIATNKPNRDAVQSAADVQFGVGSIRVS